MRGAQAHTLLVMRTLCVLAAMLFSCTGFQLIGSVDRTARGTRGLRSAHVTMDDTLSKSPLAVEVTGPAELASLASALISLEPTALVLAELTDAIDASRSADTFSLQGLAHGLRRTRRQQLLTDMLRADRDAYVKCVSFLPIPREELPNLQDIPIRSCDRSRKSSAAASSVPGSEGQTADGLVPDCELAELPMGENALEAAILSVTRDIYASETGVTRVPTGGIRGLIEEMRTFMLSPSGSTPARQQDVLIRTLRKLMTPFLPPFYRVFMGGIVPGREGDPEWLVDGVQGVASAVNERMPWLPFNATELLAPGRQLGPLPYAPALTSVVAPYAFGFLVGPSRLNRRADGGIGGLVVEKCKFLQESNCKGMCLNSCKLPAQVKAGPPSAAACTCPSVHAPSALPSAYRYPYACALHVAICTHTPTRICICMLRRISSTSLACRCESFPTLRRRSASGRLARSHLRPQTTPPGQRDASLAAPPERRCKHWRRRSLGAERHTALPQRASERCAAGREDAEEHTAHAQLCESLEANRASCA